MSAQPLKSVVPGENSEEVGVVMGMIPCGCGMTKPLMRSITIRYHINSKQRGKSPLWEIHPQMRMRERKKRGGREGGREGGKEGRGGKGGGEEGEGGGGRREGGGREVKKEGGGGVEEGERMSEGEVEEEEEGGEKGGS